MPINFSITVNPIHHSQGLINIPAEVDEHIGLHGEEIEVFLATTDNCVRSRINRNANRNGTARIAGRAAIALWFRQFPLQTAITASILTSTSILLLPPSNSRPQPIPKVLLNPKMLIKGAIMPNYTENEKTGVSGIVERLKNLLVFLSDQTLDESLESEQDLDRLFGVLAQSKAIQGNSNNDISLTACLLAKRYLAENYDIGNFDAAAKPQGAPGLDIDLITSHGVHIIGEIKTTVPYSGANGDLGANQKKSFEADFAKLAETKADHKFFFVTGIS